MKTPFTTDQFLETLKNYNHAVFPSQVVLFATALLAFYLAMNRSTKWSNQIISLILGFLWLWMGVIYHLSFFTRINSAAYIFAGAFILQALYFFWVGLIQNKLAFEFEFNKFGIAGLGLIAFALAIYPVLGFYGGHKYPYSPTFGLPCSTTIFTFGLTLFLSKKTSLMILVIPLIWSFIGLSAALSLGMIEDVSLPVAGILTTAMLAVKQKHLTTTIHVR